MPLSQRDDICHVPTQKSGNSTSSFYRSKNIRVAVHYMEFTKIKEIHHKSEYRGLHQHLHDKRNITLRENENQKEQAIPIQ